MIPTAFPSVSTALAHQVEAFEVALASDPDADIGQFLPPYGHPLHLVVLAELIRVDLEYAWSRGRPKRLAAYCSRFPAILEHDALLREVAFEEYRQRSCAGEAPSPAEYQVKYGIPTTDWPEIAPGSERAPVRPTSASALFPPTHRLPLQSPVVNGDLPATNRLPLQSPVVNGDLPATKRLPAPPPHKGPETDGTAVVADLGRQLVSEWEESTDSLPEPGRLFLGFRLVEILGQGAFGRVYLAHQGDLAGRPVALKVARDIVGESRTLAQLQHTNIVPIYSFHKIGPFQAVCMPFLGRATLADCVKQIHDSGLPSTGKQLRSTLDQRKSVTTPGSGTGSSAQPISTPGQEPAPARAIPTDQPATEVSPASAPGGWAQFDGFSYVEAVLWIGAQLADGLAHAHARGITHRDLKPANILLTDDGRPMLLDFNLAEDTKLRGSAERAGVGGTLPYMAPEHMEEFRARTGKLDHRCDLYSLGVILFELVTGQRPHPDRKGVLRESVPLMIADRRQPPPSLRQLNPDISPGVEAIVQKCLAADAADRYQQAEHLREDINRHLANRPLKYAPNPSIRERLRKWARRHPRLTSSGSVAVAAAALLIGLGSAAVYSRERTRELEAHAQLAEHQAAFRDAQVFLDDKTRSLPRLDVGLDAFRGVLARYGVPENPDGGEDWLSAGTLRYLPENARARLREDIGESFYLMARAAYLKGYASTEPSTRASEAERAAGWNALAAKYAGDRLPRAIKEQNAAIAALRGDRAEADRLRGEAATTPLVSARDLTLAGDQLYRLGHHEKALGHLVPATRLDPENFSAWFLRGCAELALKQHALAAASFGACISLRPDSAPAWLNRGLAFRGMAFAGLRFTKLARGDFDRAIELDPTLTDAYIERALLRIEQHDLAGAEADYDRALATGTAPVRVYFLRSSIRNQRGNAAGAKADREEGLNLTPADEMSWIARAENRLDADPTAALADDEEALKLNPTSIFGLQLKAHILAEHLNRPAEAMAALDRAVELNPDFVPARAGRGVMLARAGKRDAAIRDAKDALRRDAGAPILYQVGGIYALTAKTHPADKPEAIRLLWGALKRGYGLDMVDTDTDLDPIRNDPDFQQMVKDARALNARRD